MDATRQAFSQLLAAGRGRCMVPGCPIGCEGASFGPFFPPQRKPPSPDALCQCGHVFWQHLLTREALPCNSNPADTIYRGPRAATHCGGFFPHPSVSVADFKMLCYCGAQWQVHSLEVPEVSSFVAQATSAQSTAFSPGMTVIRPGLVPHNIHPNPSTVQTPLAAARTLGLFQSFTHPVPSPLGSGDLGRREAATRHARRSPVPFAHRTTVAESSRRTRHAATDTTAAKLKCAILPFVYKPDERRSLFRFSNSQRHELIEQLSRFNLVLDVDVNENRDEVAWQILDAAIYDHLDYCSIRIEKGSQDDNTQPYLHLSWSICQRHRSNVPSTWNYIPDMPEQYLFTYNFLFKQAERHLSLADTKVFFVAPKLKDLSASVPNMGDEAHICWPWRVVSRCASWIDFDKCQGPMPNTCLPECPDGIETDADNGTPTYASRSNCQSLSIVGTSQRPSRRRPAQSPGPLARPSQRRRADSPSISNQESHRKAIPPNHSAESSDTNRSVPSTNSHNPEDGTPPPPEAQKEALNHEVRHAITRLPEAAVRKWQEIIQDEQLNIFLPTIRGQGPDARLLGQNLIELLLYFRKRTRSILSNSRGYEDFQPLVGVGQCDVPSTVCLYARDLNIIIENRTSASGDGPLFAMYSMALSTIAEQDRWTKSTTDGFHVLNLCISPELDGPGIGDRYWTDGKLMALYLVTNCQAPLPISPFIILAASVDSIDQFRFSLEYAEFMIPDPPTRELVRDIFAFSAADILSANNPGNARLMQLAIDEAGARSKHLSEPRNEDVHGLIRKRMLARVLLGHIDPWTHAHFKAFREGFNEGKPGQTFDRPFLIQDNDSLTNFTDYMVTPDHIDYVLSFLAALYDCQITKPEDVWEIIRWEGIGVEDPVTRTLFQLFIIRMKRWILGVGHPRGTVTRCIYNRDRWDLALRARLLYRAATGSSMLLVGEHRKYLKFRVSYHPDKSANEPLVQIHVCFNEVCWYINSHVRNILLEPGTLDNHLEGKEISTHFDTWLHEYILSSSDVFNDI